MFLSIFSQTIIYTILIALVHYLYLFFKNNLTTPKVIDLVNRPTEVYKKMYTTSKNESNITSNDMKNELKDYFKNLKKTPTTTKSTNIQHTSSSSEPSEMFNSQSFSNTFSDF